MARLKLGPGFTLIPVATGGGHLSDVHTGDALVVPQADMVLLQQTSVSGLDLKTPGARELFERYRPFLAESAGGDAFYELDFDDAPTLAPVTSADPRPSPARAVSLGPLIAEELRREEPISTLIAEELTEPSLPAIAIPPPPPSSPKYVTRVAQPIAKPEAVTQTTPALAPLPSGPPPMEPEPWSIEPAPQAFVPREAEELAQKIAQQPFSFDATSTDLHPTLPMVAGLPADDDEPMAELEELPPEEQDAVTGEPLPEEPPSPSAGADVLALVGQAVFERTPSWSESPVPAAPAPAPAVLDPLSLPDAPTLPGGVLPPELFAPPAPAPAPVPDVTQSQADHLRQALNESGVAPVAAPVASAPPPVAAARGKALTFTLAGIALLVVGVGVTMALKPGSDVEVPTAELDAGVARVVTPPPPVEVVDAGVELAVEIEVVTKDAGRSSVVEAVVDAAAAVAVVPSSGEDWIEGAVQARGRVKMGQVVAGDDGTLTWSVGDGQRVKSKQAVGALARAKGELALASDNVGLLMIKQQGGEVKRGVVLADIIYFEAWAKAVLKGKPPTSAWKCEVASAAKGQSAPCKISVVTPKPGGAQVTVAVEPMWFDGAPDAVVRVAP